MLQFLYFRGLPMLHYLHCCISSIIAGPPLFRPHLHCIRTSNAAGPIPTSTVSGLHYCRNSNIAGTLQLLNLCCPRTSTGKRCPLLQQLHCDSNSIVSGPQCCRTSTHSRPLLSQCLCCCRIYTVPGPLMSQHLHCHLFCDITGY